MPGTSRGAPSRSSGDAVTGGRPHKRRGKCPGPERARDSVFTARAVFIEQHLYAVLPPGALRDLDALSTVFRIVVVGGSGGVGAAGREILPDRGGQAVAAYARRGGIELYASWYLGDAPDIGVRTMEAPNPAAALKRIRARERRSRIVVGDEALERLAASLRKSGKRIVLTNGVFDLVHIGHLRLLEAARALGDVLVVAINSDDSTRAIKGASRPVVPQFARAETLTQVRWVDYCCIFTETDPLRILSLMRPAVLAKGSDYSLRNVVGGRFVSGYGGTVARLPLIRGCSTTSTITRIATREAVAHGRRET
jgi:D-glycero-beta-D-manno-heptose 1-phosphate adenylyltransferase